MNYFEEKPGSIFFIPLFLPTGVKENIKDYSRFQFDQNKSYGFGRLIKMDKSGGDLIEVFKYSGAIPESSDKITDSSLLMEPVHISMAFGKKRWRFIFEDSNYDPEKNSDYSNISFLLGDDDDPKLWKGGKQSIITKEEAKKYQPWIVYPPSKLEELIKSKIKP